MGGLCLNAYPLTFSGQMSLWRLAVDAGAEKDQVQARAGCSVWRDEEECWWSASAPEGTEAEQKVVPALPVTGLGLFVLRESLVGQASANGYEAWVSRGEVQVLGLLPAHRVDVFMIEPQLSLRAVREQYIDVHAMLQFRHRGRWRVTNHLGDLQTHPHAAGGRAVRLRGEGPRRARVVQVSTSELVLEVGEEIISAAPQDYALAANAQMVASWRGHDVLRRLRVASGMYTSTGRPDLSVIKTRFTAAREMVRLLGLEVRLPGQARVDIDPRPIEVEMQDS